VVWAAAKKMYWATTNRATGKFEMGYNLPCHFDFEYLPGRKYDLFWDPEGLLSTLPAFVSGLLGILAGLFLRNSPVPDQKKALCLIVAGVGGVAVDAAVHRGGP
jgi:hypothetical protein